MLFALDFCFSFVLCFLAFGQSLASLGHSWVALGRSWAALDRSWPLLAAFALCFLFVFAILRSASAFRFHFCFFMLSRLLVAVLGHILLLLGVLGLSWDPFSRPRSRTPAKNLARFRREPANDSPRARREPALRTRRQKYLPRCDFYEGASSYAKRREQTWGGFAHWGERLQVDRAAQCGQNLREKILRIDSSITRTQYITR